MNGSLDLFALATGHDQAYQTNQVEVARSPLQLHFLKV
jgi:hypothetical protein